MSETILKFKNADHAIEITKIALEIYRERGKDEPSASSDSIIQELETIIPKVQRLISNIATNSL